MHLADEASLLVIHDDDAALRQRRNVGGAAASGEARALAVLLDPMGVQVAEAVDLRAAYESQIHSAGLQQTHDLVQTGAVERARHVGRIAHGEDRFQRRPIADNAVFENADRGGRASFLGHGEAEQRQAHADEDLVAVANFPRGRRDHQFAESVIHSKVGSGQCSVSANQVQVSGFGCEHLRLKPET